MFLKLTRIWPPEDPFDPYEPEVKESYVINTDKILAVSEEGDCELRIELVGCDVVIAEATLPDFASIVGAKSLPGPWDKQK